MRYHRGHEWQGIVLAVLLLAPASAQGQQPLFTSRIDLVHLGVTVVDREGNLVTDLTRDDFEVLEDGRPQEVRYFSLGLASDAETIPLHIGMLLDMSSSMERNDRFQKTAAIRFLNTLTYAADITLVDFDTEVRVGRYGQQDFGRLIERVRGRRPQGYTALYDALGVYLDGAFEQDGRKVLVLYTDGEDTRSRLSMRDARDLLRASDVTVYAIGFQQQPAFQGAPAAADAAGPVDGAHRGHRVLSALAERARGDLRDDRRGAGRAVLARVHLDQHAPGRELARGRGPAASGPRRSAAREGAGPGGVLRDLERGRGFRRPALTALLRPSW